MQAPSTGPAAPWRRIYGHLDAYDYSAEIAEHTYLSRRIGYVGPCTVFAVQQPDGTWFGGVGIKRISYGSHPDDKRAELREYYPGELWWTRTTRRGRPVTTIGPRPDITTEFLREWATWLLGRGLGGHDIIKIGLVEQGEPQYIQ